MIRILLVLNLVFAVWNFWFFFTAGDILSGIIGMLNLFIAGLMARVLE